MYSYKKWATYYYITISTSSVWASEEIDLRESILENLGKFNDTYLVFSVSSLNLRYEYYPWSQSGSDWGLKIFQ
jgi:hypothetical protein